MHVPRLLLSFCDSMTSHIRQFSDTELLACLQLVAKIFSHIQSPVTHVASADTGKALDGRVGDQLEPTEKPSVNSFDMNVAAGR